MDRDFVQAQSSAFSREPMSKSQGVCWRCRQNFHSPKKQEEGESQEEEDDGEGVPHGVEQLQGRQQGVVFHLSTDEE